MAEHTKTHLWINTAIAASALLAAIGSALVSYRSYNLNTEAIGLSATFTYDCPLSTGGAVSSSKPGKVTWETGLCWRLTVANQSTARTSIVNFETDVVDEPKYQQQAHILTDKGVRLLVPLAFDGGEARTFIARIMIPGSPLLEKLVQDFTKANKPDLSLSGFAYYAAQSNLDVLGNPVEKEEFLDKIIFVTFPTNYKGTTVSLRLKTGRGNTFSTELRFPTGSVNTVGSGRCTGPRC